jgi:hypothetical protein
MAKDGEDENDDDDSDVAVIMKTVVLMVMMKYLKRTVKNHPWVFSLLWALTS